MSTPRHDPIPSLEQLGDRLELAAARSIADEGTKSRRPSPRSSPLRSPWMLLPALGALVVLAMLASVLLTDGTHVSETAAAEVVGAMKKSSSVATGRFHLSVDVDSGAGPTHLDADGAYDTGAGRVKETIDASSLLRRMAPQAAAVPSGRRAEVVVDRGTIYASIPALGSRSGQNRWFRLGGAPASGATTPITPSAADPSGLLDLFGGVTDVEQLGEEDIEGVAVRHYRGQVDLGKAYGGLSDAERRRLDESVGSIGGGLPHAGRIPVEVWVDGQGMVRRLASELELAAGLGEKGLRARFTIDFTELGEPVDIQIPDSATVTELSGLGDLLLGPGTATTR